MCGSLHSHGSHHTVLQDVWGENRGPWVDLKEIPANHPVPQEGEAVPHQHCVQWKWELLTMPGDIVMRWKE